MKQWKTVVLGLELFEPYWTEKKFKKVDIEVDGETCSYFKKPLNGHSERDFYNHFSVPVDLEGNPWHHASLYLMSKLDSPRLPNSKSLNCICEDLARFRESIEAAGLDYKVSPRRKLRRPTYAYRAILQDLISDGKIAKSTASRRMSSVVGFYRWLQNEIIFEYPIWNEHDIQIRFLDNQGFSQRKTIKSTDLRVKLQRNRNDHTDKINDGGSLKPLSKVQQDRLIRALLGLNNPEMMLAFLIALTTGARMQTVFTIRLKHIDVELDSNMNALPILVGQGTGVDTKYQKRICIYIPSWLLEKLKIYMNSKRALVRRGYSNKFGNQSSNQYLFLSQVGSPYYIASDDVQLSEFRYPPRGNSVRQFISAQLKPELGKEFINFKFHDLRATYGMNLLEEKINSLEDGRGKLFDVLLLIKTRMGHSNINTTQQYLDYKGKTKLAAYAQSDFEKYLEKLIGENE